MNYDEALTIVTAALDPKSLSTLQIDIFRETWMRYSYTQISLKLKHEYSYIKDVGAELWQLLTQALGITVTKLNLQNAVKEYSLQGRSGNLLGSPSRSRIDWGESPDLSEFYGRAVQLATLEQWTLQDSCQLVAIVGMGGIGKTLLVTQLMQQLADTDRFAVIVWRSLRQAPPLIELLTDLMSAIAPEQQPALQLDVLLRQLLTQLRDRRCLLVLDNLEAVFSSGELTGTYRAGYEDYGWLLGQLGTGRHQSSVLVTSREIPVEVAHLAGPTAAVRLLRLERLSIEAGSAILAAKGC